MTVRQRDTGSVQQTIKGIAVRDAGNVLRTIKDGKIRDDGSALRAFFYSVTMVVNPISATINASSYSHGADKVVSTGPQPFTVIGGTAPLTYAWSSTVGDPELVCEGPTTNAPTFYATLAPNEYKTADFQCLITDATGSTLTIYRTVNLTLTYVNPGGPL